MWFVNFLEQCISTKLENVSNLKFHPFVINRVHKMNGCNNGAWTFRHTVEFGCRYSNWIVNEILRKIVLCAWFFTVSFLKSCGVMPSHGSVRAVAALKNLITERTCRTMGTLCFLYCRTIQRLRPQLLEPRWHLLHAIIFADGNDLIPH